MNTIFTDMEVNIKRKTTEVVTSREQDRREEGGRLKGTAVLFNKPYRTF